MNRKEIEKRIQELDKERELLISKLVKTNIYYSSDDVEKISELAFKRMDKLEKQQEKDCRQIIKSINGSLKKIKNMSEKNKTMTYCYLSELDYNIYYVPSNSDSMFNEIILDTVDEFLFKNKISLSKTMKMTLLKKVKNSAIEKFDLPNHYDYTVKGSFEIDG